MLLLLSLPNVCESGRFCILLLYPLSGCLTFGITLSVLPSHQKIIRHNEYYVKSRRQGSNLRPEIYKIPALSLSYSGKAPQPRFERGTAKLTVLSSTTELLGIIIRSVFLCYLHNDYPKRVRRDSNPRPTN